MKKTTVLLKILAGLYKPDSGTAVIAGEHFPEKIRRQIVLVMQNNSKDAPVILLDEPVSALDQDTGHSVLDALSKLTDGRTVIHVTHHQETLDDSYTIYRMEGGKMVRG
ncbi:MAG: hypothetical protein K2I96_16325 [Lachnospiraceae bacterium]|nr:hypothetical protein [Lachnospiraceae bacterium]